MLNTKRHLHKNIMNILPSMAVVRRANWSEAETKPNVITIVKIMPDMEGPTSFIVSRRGAGMPGSS